MNLLPLFALIPAVSWMLSCSEHKQDDQFTMTSDKVNDLMSLKAKHSDFIEMIGTRDGGPYKQEMTIQGALGSTMRYGNLKFTVPPENPGHYEFMPFVDKAGERFALIYKIRELHKEAAQAVFPNHSLPPSPKSGF